MKNVVEGASQFLVKLAEEKESVLFGFTGEYHGTFHEDAVIEDKWSNKKEILKENASDAFTFPSEIFESS